MSNYSEFVSFQNFSAGLQNLGTFWGGREFSDVTLVTSDGGHITAHRLVLSLFSELFRTAFARCPNQPHTLIYLAGLKGKQLEQLVKDRSDVFSLQFTAGKSELAYFCLQI